jgi:hypothetical protein
MPKLNQEAINKLILLIELFDRERGVPHNYFDLEKELKNLDFEVEDDILSITNDKKKY